MRGFTLIEFTISLGIIGVLMLLTFISAFSFRAHTDLTTSANNFLEDARSQQSKTLASEFSSKYGAHLETTRYTLFKGPSFSSRDPSFDEVRNLPPSVEFSSWNLIGGDDLVFERISGATQNTGSVSIRHQGSGQTKTITVGASGELFFSGPAPIPSGTRIIDTRHVHYTLGWSMQGSSTLTLSFPGTGVSQNIPIQNYMAGGQFDWSGTIIVSGSNQILRINTHLLTPVDSVLSVHRERDENTAALDLLIDNNLITHYDQSGNVTVGPFGGVMEIQ